MYRKILINIVALLTIILPLKTLAQVESENKEIIKLGGYINWSALYDSRQNVIMREGLLLLFPSNIQKDEIGNDVNAKSNLNFLTIQTRLNAKIGGTKIFNADVSGFVEGEFFGTADGDVNGFRLRHAYVDFKWENSSLLVGQMWHPMMVTDAFPQVLSYNTGAPFQPISRNPQIRFTQKINSLKLIGVLYTQRDFSSNGPNGYSSSYLKNSALPAMHLQFQYGNGDFLLGAGADYKKLTPRIETMKKYSTDQHINSFGGLAFLKFKHKDFMFIAEGIYGQNLADILMLGGYAVSKIDTVRGYENYTNIAAYSFWGDFSFGKNLQFGLFAGYTKNLGAQADIVGKIYARGENIGSAFRIAPRIQYAAGNIKIGLELESTNAEYGSITRTGKISNSLWLNNTRILLAVFYNI
jgi:hypothetical protein